MDPEQLRADGYTVVEDVVEEPVRARLLDALREVGGIDVADPATWAGKPTQGAMGGVKLPGERRLVGLDPYD